MGEKKKLEAKQLIFGFLLLVLAVFIILLRFLWAPLFVSLILAFVINPIVNSFERKGASRSAAILTTYFIFLVLIFLLTYIFMPIIINDIQDLVKVLPLRVEDWHKNIMYVLRFTHYKWPSYLADAVNDTLVAAEESIRKFFTQFLEGIINFFRNIFLYLLVPFFTFYISRDYRIFKTRLLKYLNAGTRKKIVGALSEINLILNTYLRGQLLVAFLVGIMISAGLWLLKIEFALPIGLFAGFFNLIPYFGPLIGAFPAVLLALAQSPWSVLHVIILFIIINQIEALLITPKVFGSSMGLHPMLIILGVLLAGRMFGILGMLISVPFLGICKVLLNYFYAVAADYKVNS